SSDRTVGYGMTQSATKRPRKNPLATPSFCGPAKSSSSAARICFCRSASIWTLVSLILRTLSPGTVQITSRFGSDKIDITHRPCRLAAKLCFDLHADSDVGTFDADQSRKKQRVHSV